MFHTRSLNNKINERAFRITYNDRTFRITYNYIQLHLMTEKSSSSQVLLDKDTSVKVHHRNIRHVAMEF